MNIKGIILHGGYGTRLRPLTHTGPKQLIPVANKPISQYVLDDLIETGVKEIAILLGDVYPEKVKDYYGDGSKFGAKISYIYQGEPKGIAHAVGLCEEYVGNEPFVVYLGDNLLKGGIDSLMKKFKTLNYDALVLLCQVKNPQRFGVAKFDENGKLTELVEKPKEPPSHYALTGIYFLKPLIFDTIKRLKPSWRGELEITEAVQRLLDNGYEVGYQIVDGWWKDTGTPEDILEVNRLVLDELKLEVKGKVENDSSIQGRVVVGNNSIVNEDTLIRGPAIIGENIRDWIYVQDHCEAIDLVLRKGETGEIYNISARNEIPNIEIARKILQLLDKPEDLITFVEDRPGHDIRYSLDSSKIRSKLGWRPKFSFEEALEATVKWYVHKESWWKPLATDEIIHPTPWKLSDIH